MPLPRIVSTGVEYTPAGAMVQEITLLAPSTVRDSETGEFGDSTEFQTLFANISALSGRELEKAQQLVAEVTHKVVLPYLPGVTTAMMVRFRGRFFQIESITDPDESQIELRLLCRERNAPAL